MRIIKTISRMRRYVNKARQKGKTIGFVPTMGYLHEGHLSLMRQARLDCEISIASIFVNPLQFGPGEDYQRYPRDLERDQRLAKSVGVDAIFYPSLNELYPKGFLTYVQVEKITDCLCGKARPGHFRGVATVVTKLFNIVKPDIAYFGQKDAQQAIVIKKMVRDLNMDIKVKIMPIVREPDGLAMSSRNTYLNFQERKDATVLYESLREAKVLIKGGSKDPRCIVSAIKKKIRRKKTAKIEYISIVDLDNLAPVKKICGRVLIALAVRFGKARLIDNIIINSNIKNQISK
jgi:pantoate--beta-alanine ligase